MSDLINLKGILNLALRLSLVRLSRSAAAVRVQHKPNGKRNSRIPSLALSALLLQHQHSAINSTSSVIQMASRMQRVREILGLHFRATHLDVINESHMHNVPKDAETHFKVVIVTPDFEGVARVKREQRVQGLLKPELDNGLHALSIVAKTPIEWDTTKKVDQSPSCRGGFGK